MSLDVRTWRLKIEALLLPTPLCELDPTGELARAAEVRRIFALPESGDDAELLEAARRDAADAQAAGVPEVPGGEALRPERLLHPLDPGTWASAPSRAEVDRAWDGLIGVARGLNWASEDPEALAAAYRRLWWAFAGDRVFQRLPHEARMPDHSLFAHRSLAAAIAGARSAGGEAALLLAQTGPVQETIEASRRTSDLWMGSFLYSYLSYHALAALVDTLGPDAIVSPQPKGLALAELGIFKGFGEEPTREERVQPSLPAKVLAVVPRAMVQELANRVSDTILETWQAMAAAVREWVDKRRPDGGEGWNTGFGPQIDAAVERGVVVLPWPSDLAKVRAFLGELWWGSQEGGSVGELYGPMSGVLWRLSSSVGRASLPARHAGDARRKCTVCGEREQMGPVGKEKHFWSSFAEIIAKEPDRESIQFKDGEGLCAVCLTRRLAPQVWFGGDRSQARDPLLNLRWTREGNRDDDRAYLRFPSVASVAVAPFRKVVLLQENHDPVRVVLKKLLGSLEILHVDDALRFTAPGNLIPGVAGFGRSSQGESLARRLCDYDGTWMDSDAFEPDRAWRDHFGRSPPREGEDGFNSYQRLAEPLRQARDAFSALCEAVDVSPSAYYAVLYLDGDQMSRWLNGIHERTPLLREVVHPSVADGVPADRKRPVFPALQSELSRRLSSLAAGEVAKIVHAHLGRLVYCGGDDVVALLPLITALPCAQKIYELLQSDAALGPRATASAGLVFAHWRDPLGPILRAARKAEKRAKDDQVLFADPGVSTLKPGRPERLWAAYGEALSQVGALQQPRPPRDRDDAGRPLRSGRDRLAIRVETRSGAPLELTLPWGFGAGTARWSSVAALHELIALPDRADPRSPAISLAFGYALRDEVRALHEIPMGLPTRLWSALRKRVGDDQEERLARALRLPYIALAMGDERPKDAPEPADPKRDELLVRGEDRAINTILFARFLARESRGVNLDAILKGVG